MGIEDITRESVLKAITEFDQNGIDATLEKYGFKDAIRYYLIFKDKKYPSKAIIDVAHKYARPDIGYLKSSEFAGGRNTVQKKLEQLNFQVLVGPVTKKMH